MKRILRFALVAISMLLSVAVSAQVTTSGISGKITGSDGTLPGATIVVRHVPSGTTYGTTSNSEGRFNLQGLRSGGPYRVDITFVGYHPATFENVTLKLGETYVLNANLKPTNVKINEVEVVAIQENSIMNSEKSGTSTNITSEEIEMLPTIERSINDLVKMTPQSTGMAFGGRDSRYNNFTVDGAGFNNNFGLSSDLPGGSNGPISIDALEQISVNIAPYDVRQSRFTGAAINAITKSGTNEIKGSVYTFQQFPGLHGYKVAGDSVANAVNISSQTYGLSVGGPLVKNKLFFFINGEYSPMVNAGPSWKPYEGDDPNFDGDQTTNTSRTTVADLARVKQYLLEKYNYDPGEYGQGGWSTFNDYNYKIMARLDWNINRNNKLMFRFNKVQNSVMNLTNASSCPSGLYRDRNYSRMGVYSIAFSNNFYRMNNNVTSFALDWNSRISDRVSNQLLASYNMIGDQRSTPSSTVFPHVDIYKDGHQYMSFGTELFSYHNEVINNTADIIDNVTIDLGNHTITAGFAFEWMYVRNSYIREGTSYYRYASVDDFLNNATPIGMGITYGYNGNDAPGQMLTYAQESLYAQDEWNITDNFKLTYGIRLELPNYLDKDMVKNNVIDSIARANNFAGGEWNTGTWPKSNISVNPRLGFNWDINGDRSLQLRGGTGIFTGVNPFVWFTNQVGSAAFVQSPEMSFDEAKIASELPGITFYENYKDLLAQYPNVFPTTADADYLPTGSTICLVDKNFKFPQVWRSNLALDVELPWNMVLTLEALYTRDVVGVKQLNVNQTDSDLKMFGSDNRTVWEGNPNVSNDIAAAMLFTNTTKKGYSTQLTAQLTKNMTKGFSGMIAYTYSIAKDLTSNPGSAAYSAWTSSTAVNSLNDEELGYSVFSVPHRVVGDISYRIDYAKHFATTISLYYEGQHNGRISYVYNGDVNGDGISADLIYVPKSADEINFVDMVDKDGNVLMTASAQADVFMNYINNNKYLKSRMGDYAERFGGLQRWVNEFNVKLAQDIYTTSRTDHRYGIQITADILNIANMINSNWGCYYTNKWLNYQNLALLNVVDKGTSTTAPTYTLRSNDFEKDVEWTPAKVASNCWGILLGLRLIF